MGFFETLVTFTHVFTYSGRCTDSTVACRVNPTIRSSSAHVPWVPVTILFCAQHPCGTTDSALAARGLVTTRRVCALARISCFSPYQPATRKLAGGARWRRPQDCRTRHPPHARMLIISRSSAAARGCAQFVTRGVNERLSFLVYLSPRPTSRI